MSCLKLQNNSPVVDKFKILYWIEKFSPTLREEGRRRVLYDIENEVRSIPPYKRSQLTDNDLSILVQRLCREERERSLNSLERRQRNSREWWTGVELSRRDVLRDTTSIALDYDFPAERRNSKMEIDPEGDIALVDVTRLHPRGEFCVAKFDYSFLPDLRRLHHALRLKDGRLVVKTFREDLRGVRERIDVALISIVCAKKIGKDYDCVFNTAKVINGNPLDLRAENVIAPAHVYSAATQKENRKFNGWNEEDGPIGSQDKRVYPMFDWLHDKISHDPTPARPKAKKPTMDKQQSGGEWTDAALNTVRPKRRKKS